MWMAPNRVTLDAALGTLAAVTYCTGWKPCLVGSYDILAPFLRYCICMAPTWLTLDTALCTCLEMSSLSVSNPVTQKQIL